MRLLGLLKRATLVIAACLTFSVVAAAPVTLAQDNSVQQAIDSGLCAGSNLHVQATGNECQESTQSANQSIDKVINTIVHLFSAIVGIVAVFMIIAGGFRYVTSGGSDSSVTSAKNMILYAIIGLIIVALAQVLVHFTINKINNG